MTTKQPKSRAKGNSYYGKIAQQYFARRAKQKHWHDEQREMQVLLAGLETGLSVCDVPFGTGRFVPLYLERGLEITGLEISEDMVASAHQILGPEMEACQVVIGSSLNMPFEDDQFDLLVSTRFLQDIIVASDAEIALAEFARVTKTYAIIQLGETTGKGATKAVLDSPLGAQLDAKGNEKLLRKHGFSVVEKRLTRAKPSLEAETYLYLVRKG